MRITKIAAISGAVILGVVTAMASLRRPSFTTLNKVYYTNGGIGCPFVVVISIQFTTNGISGSGVQASIRTVTNLPRKMWGACNRGIGSHPAHMHFF